MCFKAFCVRQKINAAIFLGGVLLIFGLPFVAMSGVFTSCYWWLVDMIIDYRCGLED